MRRAPVECLARIARVAAVGFALAAGAATVCGAIEPAGVENPRTLRRGWVTDEARVLTPGARAELDSIGAALERATGAELAVVTVSDVGSRTPKEFATELFNRWHIGKAGRDNGALLLIAVGPRRVEIETGYGVEGVLPDARAGRLLREFVVPRFKQGDYSGGAVAGASEIARVLGAGRPLGGDAGAPAEPTAAGADGAPLSTSASTEPGYVGPAHIEGRGVPARVPSSQSGSALMAVLLTVASALVAFTAVLSALEVRRRRVRECPRCGRQMRRLDAVQEKAYLGVEERLEERLGSMDHRVWRCDPCGECHIEHEERPWRGFTRCPRCGRQTLALISHMVVPATLVRAGKLQVVERCRNRACAYTKTRVDRIPCLGAVSPSDGATWGGGFSSGGSGGGGSFGGGGGSFGGGSSGGGGAGAGW